MLTHLAFFWFTMTTHSSYMSGKHLQKELEPLSSLCSYMFIHTTLFRSLSQRDLKWRSVPELCNHTHMGGYVVHGPLQHKVCSQPELHRQPPTHKIGALTVELWEQDKYLSVKNINHFFMIGNVPNHMVLYTTLFRSLCDRDLT
jgi:hypothetical protein